MPLNASHLSRMCCESSGYLGYAKMTIFGLYGNKKPKETEI